MGHVKEGKNKNDKKYGGIADMKKVLAIILSAVLFGVLAGGTMVGINVASSGLLSQMSGTEQSQAAGQETEAAQETPAG